MDHGHGRMGQRPDPRPAVQSAVFAHLGPDVGRRHREIPLVRHDPWRGAGLRQEAGTRIRRQVAECAPFHGGAPLDLRTAAREYVIMKAVTAGPSEVYSTSVLVRRLLVDEALGYWPRYAIAF